MDWMNNEIHEWLARLAWMNVAANLISINLNWNWKFDLIHLPKERKDEIQNGLNNQENVN